MENKVKEIRNKVVDIYSDVFQIYPFKLYVDDNYIVFEFNYEITDWCIDEFKKDIDSELNDIYQYICDTICDTIKIDN